MESHGTTEVTPTRRGVGFILLAEIVLVALGVLFFLGGGGFLVPVGFAAAAGLAGLATIFLWQGRRDYQRDRTRALLASFALLALVIVSLSAILLSLASTFSQTGNVADLKAPIYVLPVLLLADAASLLLVLWPLAGRAERVALALFAGGALVAAPTLLVQGLSLVEDLALRFGRTLAEDSPARDDVIQVFLENVRPLWAVYVVASRAVAGWAIYQTLGRLVERERVA